ncbi:hypothetical protein [Maricaulis sp.]|uniref:hypothetical protein n=1 Tax=Maricaulis sp. TaxID=1486257 RepID=UPI00261DAA9D|nr:hypothetical protein [Maricaulis sp.]
MKTRAFLKTALLAATASVALLPAPASAAAEEGVDWILNMRLRGESVDQDGAANEAEALTLRTRFGVQATLSENFSFLIEGENVTHLVDDFNDTTNGLAGYPVIADPEATELNRAQISWTHADGYSAMLGRQRIILGDARYVGNVGFRQNEQTFDAAVFGLQPVDGLNVTYAYLDRVHRIFGDDHPAGELDLNAHALLAAYDAGAGTLTGFAILADVEDAGVISNATYGVNWTGTFGGEGEPSWRYLIEYAHQSDHADNPLSFDLSMFRAEIGVSQNGLNALLGVEQLNGNGTVGFMTPLATLHKFQGWADAFLTTPADGIRDIYIRVGYTFPEVPIGQSLNTAIIYHDFDSENGGGDLGSEIDFVVNSGLTDNVSLQFKAAIFDGGDSGPADRDKFWLGLTYSR